MLARTTKKGLYMNVLVNMNRQRYRKIDREIPEAPSVGEKIAVGIIVFMTASYLAISIWCAILLLEGNTAYGGPLGLICRLIHPV